VIKACFAIPGDIETPTGGYVYDRQVIAALPSCGVEIRHLALPGGFPFPTPEAVEETGRLLAAVPAEEVLIIDGLALGVLPPSLLEKVAAPIIALHHHPLGLETGLTSEQEDALLASEKAATACARHVIVTSQTTAEILVELEFAPPPQVTVAMPGIVHGKRAESQGGVFQIVSVGTIVPRKGYDILVAALATLKDESWHCTIVGGLDRDARCTEALKAQVANEGLADRITFAGVLDTPDVSTLLSRSDVFALPSRYEGYGMAFAEAMAHGLPVLATNAPAIPGTVPEGAGILVAPENTTAFADALRKLMHDAELRRQMADVGWAHAQGLPDWKDTAGIIAGVIRGVCPAKASGSIAQEDASAAIEEVDLPDDAALAEGDVSIAEAETGASGDDVNVTKPDAAAAEVDASAGAEAASVAKEASA
jgi:glycosyltransferase involved in cell wall biosynthesis